LPPLIKKFIVPEHIKNSIKYKDLFNKIKNKYFIYFRGKNLVQILEIILSDSSRTARYKKSHILDIMLSSPESEKFCDELISKINLLLPYERRITTG